MTIRPIALALIALFALAIMACGDDGDDSFELPPSGEYVFDITGTMEVEFPAEGVSAVATGIQQTETGDVSGSLTSILAGNELTIPELGLTITFGSTTIEFGAAVLGPPVPESTGTVGPEGTTLVLYAEVTTLDGETGTLIDPLQADTIDLFPGPPMSFAPPSGWGPLPVIDPDGTDLFIINNLELNFNVTQGPSGCCGFDDDEGHEPFDEDLLDDELTDDDPLEGEPTSFTDEEGDDVFCGSDQPADNPTVDILGVNFFEAPDSFQMEVVMGASPADAFDNHNSTSVGSSVGDRGGISENHEKQARVGVFGPDGALLPGSEQDVTIGDESVTFTFAGPPPPPGTSWNVETFSQPDPGDQVACDTAEGTWP